MDKTIAAQSLRRFQRVEDPAPPQIVRATQVRSAPVPARLPNSALPVNPSPPPHSAAWAKPAMGPTVAPVNVDMLAAQVVRQIDRRITAWRERTGRP